MKRRLFSSAEFMSGGARGGFSLVEILVVVLIMGILVGVVGSLMGGFVTNFEVTDDQSIARRRAQDVFNILQAPMLYAGMGIPADNFGYYFGGATGVPDAPIKVWPRPISTDKAGKALRVVYSIPADIKTMNDADIINFYAIADSDPTKTNVQNTVATPVEIDLSDGLQTLVANGELTVNASDVRSYVTFPGIRMHPEVVNDVPNGIKKVKLTGKTPNMVDTSDDVLPRNVIRPFHDMYLVRAAVAFVEPSTSTFCMADVTSGDVTFTTGAADPFGGYPSANDIKGFKVEGIAAVHFEPNYTSTPEGVQHLTGMTVYVVAEGDNAIAERSAKSGSQQFRGEPRWKGLAFAPDIYYEEFQMQWRTRNVETDGA